MRFIYIFLIGLVVFNGVLIGISGFFPGTTEDEKATDVVNEDLGSDYLSMDTGLFADIWAQALFVSGSIFLVSTVLAVISQQYALFMGIGAFIAIISGLWSITSGVILKISNSTYVNSLIWIVFLAIGILTVFSVIEMLNAQRGAG